MSDASLRRDEREPSDPEAEVRVLARRLRSGELDARRLELAAWVGHTPSARALDAPDAPLPSLPELLSGLEAWGHPTLVRGLVALGSAVVPQLPEPQRETAHELCEEVRAWLEGGGAHAQEAILRAAERLRLQSAAPRALGAALQVAERIAAAGPPTGGPAEVRARVWRAMESLAPASPQDAAVMAVGLTAWITAQAVPQPDRARSLRRFVSWVRRAGIPDADLRDALREELVAWALG